VRAVIRLLAGIWLVVLAGVFVFLVLSPQPNFAAIILTAAMLIPWAILYGGLL
jgi:hypothetical protein